MLRKLRISTAVPGCVKIFLLNHGQVKLVMSNFIPSPKKQDVTNCTDNCTIALFPHANKFLLRINQKQLGAHIRYETPKGQAGLRKGHGPREQIPSVRESWTAQGRITKLSICFVDNTNKFERVQHFKMWSNIRSVEIAKHFTVLKRYIHAE